MGSEEHEHQDNESGDTGHDDYTHEPNADNEVEDNNNEIPIIMDKQYGTRTRENMRSRKRNCDPPQRCAYIQQ